MTDTAAQNASAATAVFAGEGTFPGLVTGLSRPADRAVAAPACWSQLRIEWHPSRNGAATLDGFTPGSVRVAWWRCGSGHK